MRMYGNGFTMRRLTPEDETRCIANIYPSDRSGDAPKQCSRKRGYGSNELLCKQHSKLMDSERGYVSIPQDKE